MTNLSNSRVPDTIAIAELALLAGRVGRSVVLGFADFPAPLLAAMWRFLASRLPRSSVLCVECQRDLKRLEEASGQFRLLIVRSPKLFVRVGWGLELAARASGARPAIFVDDGCLEIEDDPSATLVVRADAEEIDLLARFLRAPVLGPSVTPPDLPPILPTALIEAVDHLGWREQQVVTALVYGAHLDRTGRLPDTERPPLALVDYQRARELLRSSVVRNGVAPPEELAAAMVGRANVYLAARYGPYRTEENPFTHRSPPPAMNGQGRPIPITRREVADLGRSSSRLVDDLLTFVHGLEDGREHYVRMGLVGPPPDKWPVPIPTLRDRLRGWTAKQVRTRFDRLVRDGLITAERTGGNAPWEYVLPEELTRPADPYGQLPESVPWPETEEGAAA